MIKHFFKSHDIGISKRALKYANSKGDKLRIYYYYNEERKRNEYGLEFRGYDIPFIDLYTLSGYLENLAFTEM
jgi:hypothetical protein